MNQCWVNVGPTATTSAQHWPNIGLMSAIVEVGHSDCTDHLLDLYTVSEVTARCARTLHPDPPTHPIYLFVCLSLFNASRGDGIYHSFHKMSHTLENCADSRVTAIILTCKSTPPPLEALPIQVVTVGPKNPPGKHETLNNCWFIVGPAS